MCLCIHSCTLCCSAVLIIVVERWRPVVSPLLNAYLEVSLGCARCMSLRRKMVTIQASILQIIRDPVYIFRNKYILKLKRQHLLDHVSCWATCEWRSPKEEGCLSFKLVYFFLIYVLWKYLSPLAFKDSDYQDFKN